MNKKELEQDKEEMTNVMFLVPKSLKKAFKDKIYEKEFDKTENNMSAIFRAFMEVYIQEK